MVRKIILFACALLIAAVPAVMADAGGVPKSVDGKIIDIKVRALSDEIAIGQPATLEITITNLTQHTVSPVHMSLGFTWFKIDYHGEMLNIDTDELKLGAYESVTFEITDVVSDYLKWYKAGDEYFTDVEAEIEFFIRRSDSREFFYQIAEKPVTLKINNLYDGSEYIDIAWLDNRKTMYFREYIAEDYYDDGTSELCTRAAQYYDMLLKNNSDEVIFETEPDNERIINDYFSYYEAGTGIPDIHEFRFAPIFQVADKYYCVEITREYNTQFVEKPNVKIDIAAEPSNTNSNAKCTVTVENTGDSPINDLFIYIVNYYKDADNLTFEKLTNLEPNETASMEYYLKDNGDFGGLSYGYLKDGMFIIWYKDVEVKTSDTDEITFEITDKTRINVVDYDYRKKQEEAERLELESQATPVPDMTPPPTQEPTITPVLTPTSTPAITVTKHQNPMILALFIVLVLLIGALIFVIRAMSKMIKEKN